MRAVEIDKAWGSAAAQSQTRFRQFPVRAVEIGDDGEGVGLRQCSGNSGEAE